MPSPTHKGYYRRKGGAWTKSKSGDMKKVGSGSGRYAKRDLDQDRKRSARVNTAKAKRYGQSYDSSRVVGACRGGPSLGV